MAKLTFGPMKLTGYLKTYREKFGHLPSAEAMKFRSKAELEEMAEVALMRNKPIKEWQNRPNVADGDGAGRAVQLEPTVKRAEDFGNTGNYNVTYQDGTEYLIFRDTMQFSEPMWHLSPEYYDVLELDSNAIERIAGIGGNRKEALQWLNKAHSERLEKAEADAVQQELGDIEDDYDPMDDLADFDDDALFIQRKDLSPEAQNITASGVLYGDEEIPVTGTSRNGAAVVVDLARAFDARVREATDGNNLGEPNDANAEVVSDLIAHEAVQAMKTDGNAGEWYQQKVANAMSLAAQEFPELTTDPNAKFAFTSIMAITSNGASVSRKLS